MHEISSRAGGAGDAAVHWIKSSLSFANGDCVEVARLPDRRVGVRHSKDPAGPVLRFTPREWLAFIAGIRGGEFDDLPAG